MFNVATEVSLLVTQTIISIMSNSWAAFWVILVPSLSCFRFFWDVALLMLAYSLSPSGPSLIFVRNKTSISKKKSWKCGKIYIYIYIASAFRNFSYLMSSACDWFTQNNAMSSIGTNPHKSCTSYLALNGRSTTRVIHLHGWKGLINPTQAPHTVFHLMLKRGGESKDSSVYKHCRKL